MLKYTQSQNRALIVQIKFPWLNSKSSSVVKAIQHCGGPEHTQYNQSQRKEKYKYFIPPVDIGLHRNTWICWGCDLGNQNQRRALHNRTRGPSSFQLQIKFQETCYYGFYMLTVEHEQTFQIFRVMTTDRAVTHMDGTKQFIRFVFSEIGVGSAAFPIKFCGIKMIS